MNITASDIAADCFGWRERGTFALLFLSLLSDGFDLQALAFAAPGMVRDWGIARSTLAPALSAGLLGVLIGAPLIGWLGDRVGRKRAIIIGSVIYGSMSLLTATADNVTELAVLRLLTGIGLGGVLPNVIALTAEVAPLRIRSMLTALVTVGISLGGVSVGLVAAAVVPLAGWQALFTIGGIIPLVVAVLVAIALPESPVVRAEHGRAAPSASSDRLLGGPFRVITPVIWILFAGLLMTLYLLSSWLPLMLEADGMSAQGAALMNTLLQFGGVVGGIGASLLIGRLRLWLIPILLGGAWLMLVLLAAAPWSDGVLAVALGICGICVIGGQTAINASAGLIYPPAMRARGIGAALGIGRLGSISGPLVGGAIVALGHGVQTLFLGPLVPLGIAFFAGLVLLRRATIDPTPVGAGLELPH